MSTHYRVLGYFPNQWAALSVAEARLELETLIADKTTRVELLAAESGVDLDGSDVSFTRLSEWMWSEIEPSRSNPLVPNPYWRSIARDIGLYWGDTHVTRWPQLKWDLVRSGPTFVDFREPVINGFPAKRLRRDVCLMAFAHACGHLLKDGVERADVGDGVSIEIELGPVNHEHFGDVLRASGRWMQRS